MSLIGYIVRRILQAIPTMLVILIIVFALIRLTGDPATLILGQNATSQAVEALRNEWGLNDPLVVQFLRYMKDVFTGNLGTSLRYSQPVTTVIGGRIVASLFLVISAIVIAVAVSVPLGVLAAVKWNTAPDAIVRIIAVVGQAVPRFYLGILLLLVFGWYLRWLPTGGYGSFSNVILPAFTLATPAIALLTRLTRSSVLDVLQHDYVRTARGKGLSERVVLYRHVLRNAIMTPFTMILIEAARMIGGAVVVEVVFSWPGLGQLAVSSIYARDFPLVQGIVIVFALFIIVANILADVMYTIIDPTTQRLG